jgi:hypothetical protein
MAELKSRVRHPVAFISIVAFLTAVLPAGAAHAAPVGFGISTLAGTAGGQPTTLQWGPDGRLYVGHFNGTIRAYTVTRDGANDYRVTGTETIAHVSNITNHDDDGTVNSSVDTRLLLGIVVTGSAQNPVIYATSSDPRIGAGSGGGDLNLDTNSGTLSRLTWNGSAWNHTILVRGLPRSEENHGPNGIVLDEGTNTIYWAYGGNTNKGGPSFKFANLPEYAYSAAILSVDLDAIGNSTYDMPTLNDPDRANSGGGDVGDPFGGNDGANMAKITAGSPVQVYAPGFRNPYDVMIATVGNHAGKMYTSDNGPNTSWGDTPAGEGTSNCTNASVNESQTGSNDALHLVTAGYYGGHPNPTRGNDANTFNGGESPIVVENPVECDYRPSKTSETTSISLLPNSSNGIAEYTTDNFDGAMRGDLVLAAYGPSKIVRISLDASGTAVTLRDDNFATFAEPVKPLDITTMGATEDFPGTIWFTGFATDKIYVMEPDDFGGGGGPGCTGADNPALDEDGDGYDNADEIDNGTNPCSASSRPPDHDGDFASDLNDPDDDNDGINDPSDEFAIDPTNGTSQGLPFSIEWENDSPPAGGISNTGFTGLMTNGSTNYLNQYSDGSMVVGGAAGVFTVGDVPAGDAFKAKNSQMYGFQVGVVPPSATFQVSTSMVNPFSGISPGASQQMGIFVGDGTQHGYAKIVLKGTNTGSDKVHFLKEVGDLIETKRNKDITLPGPDSVTLRLVVNPVAGTVQGFAQASVGGVLQPEIKMGSPVTVPASWFGSQDTGLAVGLISTSTGSAPPFPATWDYLRVATA